MPADEPLALLLAESIVDVTPGGLEPVTALEEGADGEVVRFNKVIRVFEASSEAQIVSAAAELLVLARADGWEGPDFDDPGGVSGLPSTTLTKGSMELGLSYATSVYFEQWEDDEDVFSLRMVLIWDDTIDPSELEDQP